MSHYRLNDVEPSAIVTVNGSEKKIYDNNQIFLNPNDNFEFRFFNPLQEKLGIEIIFNGQKKDKSLLILNPGEDVSIDRFLNDKKKMKYSTYFIDGKNEQAVKASEKNGLVTFNFYKEELWNNINYSYTTTYSTAGLYGSSHLPHFGNTYSGSLDVSGSITNTTNYSDYICEKSDKDIVYSNYINNTTTSNTTLDSMNINATYTASLGDTTKSFTPQNQTYEKLETGRVEKGEESNQDFETIDTKFQSTPFHSISYMLKPESTKQKNIGEIRNYCPNCSYRIRKKSWNYCPKCSEEL